MVGEERTDMVWVIGKLMMTRALVDGMETKNFQKLRKVKKIKNGIQSGGRRWRRSS